MVKLFAFSLVSVLALTDAGVSRPEVSVCQFVGLSSGVLTLKPRLISHDSFNRVACADRH